MWKKVVRFLKSRSEGAILAKMCLIGIPDICILGLDAYVIGTSFLLTMLITTIVALGETKLILDYISDKIDTNNHDQDDQKYLHAAMNEVEDLLKPLEERFREVGIYLNRVLCRLRTLFLVSNRVLYERGFLL